MKKGKKKLVAPYLHSKTKAGQVSRKSDYGS